jgi:S1-C subfamily serine protease
LIGLLLLGAAVLSVPASVRADGRAEYEKWLAEKSPALVTIKFVLKVQMGGMMGGMGDQESDSEVTGVMIDPKGLVLCSNTQLGGFTGIMRRFMGPMGGSITAAPTDIKVLVGDDTEGLEAKLVARDTELDLAWIRIEEPGDAEFDYCDLSKAATPTIGQRLFAVRRMGKFFDRVTAVSEGRVGGVTTKPRDLYVPAGNLSVGLGLPIFTTDGTVVGVAIMQLPDAEDAEMNPMSMLGDLFNMQDMMGGLILPAPEVVKATKRALETAEAAEDESDQPEEGE